MDITVQELKEKLDKQETFLLIDVREQHEHEEFNVGGKLIPLGEVIHATDDLEEYMEKEIVVYCRSGNRSAMAQEILEQHGYSDVRNLKGGMLAWKEVFGG